MDTRPEVIGPGEWNALHRVAAKAIGSDGRRCFRNYVKNLAENFKCEKCRLHMQDYIKKNPLNRVGRGDKDPFKWTWQFHNTVNLRLGKPLLEFEEAWELHTKELEGCSSCSVSGDFFNEHA